MQQMLFISAVETNQLALGSRSRIGETIIPARVYVKPEDAQEGEHAAVYIGVHLFYMPKLMLGNAENYRVRSLLIPEINSGRLSGTMFLNTYYAKQLYNTDCGCTLSNKWTSVAVSSSGPRRLAQREIRHCCVSAYCSLLQAFD